MVLQPCYVLVANVLVNIETAVSVTTHVTIKRDEISHKQSTDAVLVQHSYFGTINVGSQN